MKYLDKKNLFIRERKEQFDFEYNEDVIFNSDRYDKEEITNYKTRESFIYKELVFCVDNKGGGYLYPPELYGSNKVIEEYRIDGYSSSSSLCGKDSIIFFVSSCVDFLILPFFSSAYCG